MLRFISLGVLVVGGVWGLGVELRSYSSIEEFVKSLDNELGKMKALLGDYLRRMEMVKGKAESLIRLGELLGRMSGKGALGLESQEIDLGGLKVTVNPTPKQELDVLVEVVRDLQDRISGLEKLRKSLSIFEELGGVSLDVEVLYRDGVPERVFIKMSS